VFEKVAPMPIVQYCIWHETEFGPGQLCPPRQLDVLGIEKSLIEAAQNFE
jgi:hypothetical protein